jgi:hypothetical protein
MVLQVLNTSEFVNLITKKTVKCISSFTGSLGLPKIAPKKHHILVKFSLLVF